MSELLQLLSVNITLERITTRSFFNASSPVCTELFLCHTRSYVKCLIKMRHIVNTVCVGVVYVGSLPHWYVSWVLYSFFPSVFSSLLFSSHLLSSDGGMIRIGTLATCVPAGHELSRLVPSYLAVGTENVIT